MADNTIKSFRTNDGDVKIDWEAIANPPVYDIPAKNYGYIEFDLESTSMDVSDGIQSVYLTDPLEPGKEYPYETDRDSGTFTVDFDYEYADGKVILGDGHYQGDYVAMPDGGYINFGIGYNVEGYIQIGTPASAKQLDEKYIPDSIARTSELGDINSALEEIIELQEELMTPIGDEVSY